jgi:peptidoglycan/LPS O-acetylase OafA/YrhL
MVSARVDEVPIIGLIIGAYGFAVLRMPWVKMPRWITFVGLISYSLYLLHQNIGYVLLRALPLPIEIRLPVVVAILIGLAALSYWAVERRWERATQRLAERALGLGRRSLRLPNRTIRHPTLEEEMRAW